MAHRKRRKVTKGRRKGKAETTFDSFVPTKFQRILAQKTTASRFYVIVILMQTNGSSATVMTLGIIENVLGYLLMRSRMSLPRFILNGTVETAYIVHHRELELVGSLFNTSIIITFSSSFFISTFLY